MIVQVRFSPDEIARLDSHRRGLSRSAYIRSLLPEPEVQEKPWSDWVTTVDPVSVWDQPPEQAGEQPVAPTSNEGKRHFHKPKAGAVVVTYVRGRRIETYECECGETVTR